MDFGNILYLNQEISFALAAQSYLWKIFKDSKK